MSQVSKSVMVVDDEEDIGLSLKIVLERGGFAVDFYPDPAIALKKFRPDRYDMAILDIKMPNINGFELYTRLKSIDTKIKTLFLTAVSSIDRNNFEPKVYVKKGETQLARKPIKNDDLLKLVNSMTN